MAGRGDLLMPRRLAPPRAGVPRQERRAYSGWFDYAACQVESSWSHNDQEDGGPTIQLPAAELRCTLRSELGLVYALKGCDVTQSDARR
jgi:hypothetical protein